MAKLIELKPNKTYKTKEAAIKAVEKLFPTDAPPYDTFRYIVVADETGRFYPICVGTDAVMANTHFHFVTVT